MAYFIPTITQMQSNIRPSNISQIKLESTDIKNKRSDFSLTFDECYIEHLRKDHLYKPVKELKQKQIFLLEIFINYLEVIKENKLLLSTDVDLLPRLRVRIKFATIPCFDIYEEPSSLTSRSFENGERSGWEDQSFSVPGLPTCDQWRSTYGKSCLFCMIPMELIRSMQSSPLYVIVYRSNDDNNYELPSSFVGHKKLPFKDELINCALRSTDTATEFPVSGRQKHYCTISNLEGEESCKMDIVIRLSCFGGMISTQFQSLKDGQGYLFKHFRSKSQLDLVSEKDLESYKPPKMLGKTDVVPIAPIIVSEEDLFRLYLRKSVQESHSHEDITE